MEALQQARQLYKEQHLQQCLAILNDREIYQLNAKIQQLIEITIKEVPSVNMFMTQGYFQIFERALKIHIKGNPDVAVIAKAYEGLEKYFLQLVEQPWKQEFKRIKLYGGFYRTRIKSVLPEPELIFRQAGYSVQQDKLVLEDPVRPDVLLVLAFDSRLCTELCRVITEHYEVVKGLSMSFEQAVMEILYSDRSRGRSGVFPPQGYDSSALQVGLKPLGYEAQKGDYIAAPTSKLLPHIPKREPIVAAPNCEASNQGSKLAPVSSSSRYVSGQRVPDESVDIMSYLSNRKVERQPDYIEGYVDENVLRNLHAVGQVPVPYPSQNVITAPFKNGHVDPSEWDEYYQLQMLRKREKNQLLGGDFATANSALYNSVGATQAAYAYPPGVTGRAKPSLGESVDEGIEKDLPPTSKSYSSFTVKSESSQGGVVGTKQPVSSMHSSIGDLGYNTANGSNGHHNNPALSYNFHLPQQQVHSGNLYTDGVPSLPIGPPPIPPRSLKPDYGVRGIAALPQDAYAYSAPASASVEPPTQGKIGMSINARVRGDQGGCNSRSPEESLNLAKSTMPSPKLPHSGPVLRKEHQRLTLGKSSSLKYSTEAANKDKHSASLLQQTQRSRGALSMDLTRLDWVCQRCTTRNLSSDTVCSVCSCSRLNNSNFTSADGTPRFLDFVDASPVPGMSKKPCPACTLENEPDKTHCSVCFTPLEDPFTYV